MKVKQLLMTVLMTVIMSAMPLVSQAKVTTIEDVAGRQVEVDLPAKRVVLGFYAEDYLAIGGEKSFQHVVGISRDTWKAWRPASWALYTKHNPALTKIPDVGEVEAQTFSIEKVLSLRPDVLLLADWQYKGLGADVKRIEDAGVPVVVVDYNAQTLNKHLKSTRIIGKITGQQSRAEKIAGEYKQAIDLIHERLKARHLKKPEAYVEFGNKGPGEYSFTYGKNMWGAMLTIAGGNNIAAPYVEWWGPMNPEQVLSSAPEVIFLAGTESGKAEGAMLMGQGISRKTAVNRLKGFTSRPGWSGLPAVKQKRVYGIYQGASRSILDASMIQYLAKALYPSVFSDLNPEQFYLDFYRHYLPVVPEGTFAVRITE
ncbi:corrinoid ABC transporter substrate-binding protein [Vibrio aerogenes CECT 7868]|uniref:Corrinoid ABC transporter substrate-binding protein n=1 Tax=Vibrio aerogenes CECT 7868 TaxID=1216006 RepID=A0A1M6CA50_9VIBR|nr:ABC transporter substrate-binding protein [Vibrio aerogenes]SHI57889.1 corrinoid ABC transporter substrate-binding protein [Vibrio aerogenes CECT 7868]